MAYAQRDLMSVPGSEFFYADTNYLYLSAIIMRITNQPIRKTIDEKILAPLGMAHSGFYGGVSDPVAVTYMDANADGWIQAPHIARDIGYGASAAYANAHDLLKLMRGVLGDGVENGGRFAPMLTKYVDGNGFSYGYGFEYVTLESERSGRTYEYWGHAGGPSFGVNTVVGYNPGSDSITIVLSNIHTVDAKAVYVLVQEAIVEAME